jgi:predicted RNA-binding Zn ribbon-like protein
MKRSWRKTDAPASKKAGTVEVWCLASAAHARHVAAILKTEAPLGNVYMAQELTDGHFPAVAIDFEADELLAGHHVLDFVNTLTGWGTATPFDRLDSYIRLAQWSVVAGVMEPELADIVAMKSSIEPEEAAEALRLAKELRALLHHILAAYALRAEPDYDDMVAFEAFWQHSIAAHRLAFEGDRIEVRPVAFTSLTIIMDLITRDAVDLMKRLPDKRLRLCANEDCGWLYLKKSTRAREPFCGGKVCLNQKRLK